MLYLLRKEHDKAIAAAERAIALNPNAANAYYYLGFVLINSGRVEEGIKLIEKAMRLNPIPPTYYLQDLSVGYYLLGRYEDAIEMNETALKRAPNNVFAHMHLAAAYSALGREQDARRHAEEVLRINPEVSLKELAEMSPVKDKAEVDRYIADLRRAGLK
jgi:adenylate cyclase